MDKHDSMPNNTCAPKHIRAALSELTNIVLRYQQDEVNEQVVLEALNALKNTAYYQGSAKNFATMLCIDLDAACYFWEEPWRFTQCWPSIVNLLKKL